MTGHLKLPGEVSTLDFIYICIYMKCVAICAFPYVTVCSSGLFSPPVPFLLDILDLVCPHDAIMQESLY